MKKLLFFSILIMAVLSVNYSLKEPRVNTLLLDNIEALAADEQDVPTNCWGDRKSTRLNSSHSSRSRMPSSA